MGRKVTVTSGHEEAENMNKFIFSLIVLAFPFTMAYGQYELTGQIKDSKTSESLIGAYIILIDDMSNSTISDEDGKYSVVISNAKKDIDILVQHIGYAEKLITLQLTKNKELDIELNPEAIEINEVTISESKTLGEEFVVKEITKLDIYTNPNSRADPVRAINSLPASTSVDETANLSLRGSPSYETSFVLNQVPIDDAFKLDQSNGVGQFSIFNTSIISKVDVYPSNPPLELGNATSGLISLRTDDYSSTNSRSINLTMASIGGKIEQNIGNKNSLISYANYSLNLGLKSFNKEAFKDLVGLGSFDFGNYWVSQLTETTKLKVFNYALIESYQYNIEEPAFTDIADQEKKRNQTIINVEKKLSQNTNLEFNQGINFSRGKYKLGNVTSESKKRDLFSSINLNRFSDFYSARIGMSADIHFINYDGTFPQYGWAYSPADLSLAYSSEESFITPEIYSYHKLRFNPNLVVAFSQRRTIAPANGLDNFNSNQVNISYNYGDFHNFKLSMGTYHKVHLPGQEFNEVTLSSSRHYGIDYSYAREGFSIAAAAYKKLTDYPSQSYDIMGAEVFMSYENEHIKSSLSLAHVRSDIVRESGTIPSPNDLSYFFRHLFKYKIGDLLEINSVLFMRSGRYNRPIIGGTFQDETNSYSPMYGNDLSLRRLPPYNIWDISISKMTEIGDGVLILFLSTSNILNRKNIASIKYDQEYNNTGFNYFGRRVVFFGGVYNW